MNPSMILAIALNAFKEAVRNRILYVLLFFALLILLGAWVASSLAIFGQEKIVRDLGVAAINMISVLIAVFVGVGLVYNDLDKKTIYTIISKPISRWEFLLGKYLGLLLTICVNILFMTFFFLGVLYFRHHTAPENIVFASDPTTLGILWFHIATIAKSAVQALGTTLSLGMYAIPATDGIMQASLLTMLEMAVITSFAVLFSSFSSPILSAFMTIIMFIIGRLNEDMIAFAVMMEFRAGGYDALTGGQLVSYHLAQVAAYITPNLSLFDQRAAVSGGQPVEMSLYSIVYVVGYAAAVLGVASLIFNRRNFK